ncbi:unknown [Prevotella sp. CAG:924]|nr:unknown [Prevotella sp. CAG:924]
MIVAFGIDSQDRVFLREAEALETGELGHEVARNVVARFRVFHLSEIARDGIGEDGVCQNRPAFHIEGSGLYGHPVKIRIERIAYHVCGLITGCEG